MEVARRMGDGMPKGRSGRLLVIGGHEDKEGECRILRRLVELAGGRQARILICAVASQEPEPAIALYREVFERLGAEVLTPVAIEERMQAEREAVLAAAQEATGLFFTGGDQLRITSLLGGTRFDRLVRRRLLREGLVIGGTSAGAAAMSATMIVGGEGEAAPRQAGVQMAPGMGYWEEAVIDQHFAQRGRTGRLLAALAQNPSLLGVGVDEDTAAEVEPGVAFHVIGSRSVTVLDGRGVDHSNAGESSPGEVLALTEVRLHVLPEGYGMDLRDRRPLLP